jgi:lysozyme
MLQECLKVKLQLIEGIFMQLQRFSSNGMRYMESVAEGRKHHEYHDTSGNPTIGIGHKLTVIELGTETIDICGETVQYKNGLTDKQIDDLFFQDMYSAEETVNKVVDVTLNQNQFDALCSLCFNIGNKAFSDSTLVRLLNNGNYWSVPSQMERWNKERVDGKLVVRKGLVNRRKLDISLWEGTWK